MEVAWLSTSCRAKSIAALAASVTGLPAKMRLDRDDDMITTGKRHDFLVEYSASHDAKGVLEAVDVEFNGRCGHSPDVSLGINDRAMFHSDNSYFYPFLDYVRIINLNDVWNPITYWLNAPQRNPLELVVP